MKSPPCVALPDERPTGAFDYDSSPSRSKNNSHPGWGGCYSGAPAGTRTPDTLLKRQVLYLLSYWGMPLCGNHPPKSKPHCEFRFGKEEGARIRAAFAASLERRAFLARRYALTQTANAEPSELLLTWLGWRDSNPLYRSQSPVCYHYTTSQCSHKPRPAPPASARFQWGGIWGSNPRHPEPQSGALPTELIPPYLSVRQTARPIKNSKPKP